MASISVWAVKSASSISIDVEMFGEASKSAVLDLLKTLDEPETVFLGVDRLDYTKGILQRLLAFEELLESTPTCTGPT